MTGTARVAAEAIGASPVLSPVLVRRFEAIIFDCDGIAIR
jgi:hypothetical protein